MSLGHFSEFAVAKTILATTEGRGPTPLAQFRVRLPLLVVAKTTPSARARVVQCAGILGEMVSSMTFSSRLQLEDKLTVRKDPETVDFLELDSPVDILRALLQTASNKALSIDKLCAVSLEIRLSSRW